MIKIGKDFNLKIIPLLVAGVFLITSTAYGITLSEKSQLRSLVLTNSDEGRERLKDGLTSVYNIRKRKEKPLFPISHQSKKISILLINPRSKYQTSMPEKQPVSLLFLASTLTSPSYLDYFISAYPEYNKGAIPHIEVSILDLQAEEADFDLENFLRTKQPNIVGITAPSQLFDQAATIGRVVKNTIPDALRIIGGPHVTALPEETLKDSGFQIGVMGFGEEALLELCMQYAQEEIDYSRVAGIVFKSKGGDVHVNPARDRKIPLSHAPPSANSLDLLNLEGYRPVSFVLEQGVKEGPLAMLFTARGCPFTCKFCANPSRIVEKRKLEDIVAEMEFLYKRGFRLFQFIDDTLSFDIKRIKDLCNLIIEKPWHTDIEWIASTRVNVIDEELIKLMKEAGCVGVAVGLETADEKLLGEIDKKIKLSDIRRARNICRKGGLAIKYFIMVGLPGQDWRSIKKTVDFILETDPTAITVSLYTPYPGSPWWGDSRVKFVNGTTWEDIFSHPEPHPTLRYKVLPAHTETDAMTSEEISEARQMIIDIFKDRSNTTKKELLLNSLDKKISAALFKQALELLAHQKKYDDPEFKAKILQNPYLLDGYQLFDLIREERIVTVEDIAALIELYYPEGKSTEFINIYPDVIEDPMQEPQPLGIGSRVHAHPKNSDTPISVLSNKKRRLPFAYAAVSAFVAIEGENDTHYLISAARAVGKESAGRIESVFGGHIVAGETVHSAFVREIAEELHIKINHVSIIGYKRYDENKEENNRYAFVGFIILNSEQRREMLKGLNSRNIPQFIANDNQELESYMPDRIDAKKMQWKAARNEEIGYLVLAPFELMVNFYQKTKDEEGMQKLTERFAWINQRTDGTYRDDNLFADKTLVDLAFHEYKAILPHETNILDLTSLAGDDEAVESELEKIYNESDKPFLITLNPVSLQDPDSIGFDWDGTIVFSNTNGFYETIDKLFTIAIYTGKDFLEFDNLEAANEYIKELPGDIQELGENGAKVRLDAWEEKEFIDQIKTIIDMVGEEKQKMEVTPLGYLSLDTTQEAIDYYIELVLKMKEAEKKRLGYDSLLSPGARVLLKRLKELFPKKPFFISTRNLETFVNNEAIIEKVRGFFNAIHGSSDKEGHLNPNKVAIFKGYKGKIVYFCDSPSDIEAVKAANKVSGIQAISIAMASTTEMAKQLYLSGADIIISHMDAHEEIFSKFSNQPRQTQSPETEKDNGNIFHGLDKTRHDL